MSNRSILAWLTAAARRQDWRLGADEVLVEARAALLGPTHGIVGITRVRNESLILHDTLNHMATHVDAIIAYDDASTDDTFDILRNHPQVALVVRNSRWQDTAAERLKAETRHRGLLLQLARERLRFEWTLCFDADERYIGDLHDFTRSAPRGCNGVRIQLFDAYLTAVDHAAYSGARPLLHFRKFFGPERRDILMLWRNIRAAHFEGLDSREPCGVERLDTRFHCQHFGKALSVAHWEQTCDYYVRHFPYEPYGRKWEQRKGAALHSVSDFGRPLFEWGSALFQNAVRIHPDG